MQKIAIVWCFMVLLGWSCGGKNKVEETARIKEDVATVNTAVEQLKSIQKQIDDKVVALGGTDNLPDSSKLKLYAKGSQRFARAVDKGEQIKMEMEQLATDYTDGKITKEVYEEKLKKLQEASAQYLQQVKRTAEQVEEAMQ